MPRLTIDGRAVDVPSGATILEAARRLGIDIPALCYLDGCTPSTSCMACVVKVAGTNRLVPSCAARAEDGMQVESETDEVHEARRTAIELLLSDHPADCIGPCQTACPAHMDIPTMLRQLLAGDVGAAAATARASLVLPATLGRICPAPCEKSCCRAYHDEALAIRLSHRHAAETDLAGGAATLPRCKPPNGKRVAIVGAGPAGLAAAWHLAQEGCTCTVFDDHEEAGGALRHDLPADRLPRAVLDAEVTLVARMGMEFRLGVRIGRDVALADLTRGFNAVLVATGSTTPADAEALGLEAVSHGIACDRKTLRTALPNVFAAGDAVHPHRVAVRSISKGAAAAASILQFLAGNPVTGPHRPFTTRLGVPGPDEMEPLLAGASREGRIAPSQGAGAGLTADEARRDAARCLHCDCRKADVCKLRHYADRLGASQHRYPGTRRRFEQDPGHPEIVYESAKCISCGLCIEMATRAGELFGLTFLGRGFGVRVAVPLGRSLAEGLRKSWKECVAACPTGALAFRRS